MNPLFQEAIDNKTSLFIPNYVKNVPSDWKNFIHFIDHCYKQKDPLESAEAKEAFIKGGRVRIGRLQIWGYMTIFAENPTPYFFPEMQGFIDQVKIDYPKPIRSSFALNNFSNGENITNRHDDLTHNLYFQCIGSVTWRIYESTEPDASFITYDLNPGDAIWVPSGTSHEVIAKEPRTAITIAFEPNA